MVFMWCYRPATDMPVCKLAVEAEPTPETAKPQDTDARVSLAAPAAVSGELTRPSVTGEAVATDESAQPAAASEATVPPRQSAASATQQIAPAPSSSSTYVRAVFPNLDAIISENDFTSLDAKKR